MGIFYLEGEVAGGISATEEFVAVPKMLVDTGSEYTWIPEPILKEAGVGLAKKDLSFVMANGEAITRSVGYAHLRASGFETVDEVVFGQPGDLSILGARTLEGFGARVDAQQKKLVAAGPHLAAVGAETR